MNRTQPHTHTNAAHKRRISSQFITKSDNSRGAVWPSPRGSGLATHTKKTKTEEKRQLKRATAGNQFKHFSNRDALCAPSTFRRAHWPSTHFALRCVCVCARGCGSVWAMSLSAVRCCRPSNERVCKFGFWKTGKPWTDAVLRTI